LELLERAFSESGRQSKQYADAVEFVRRKHGQLPADVNKSRMAVDQLKQSMLSAVPGGSMLASALRGPAGAAMALAAAVAVVGREVMKAATRIDETAKAAKGLGMAYSDLIALQMLAGETGGLDAGALNKGMGIFVRKLAEARVNGGALAETMRAIGLDVRELAAMNPADAFAKAADAISAIPDHAERVRVAVSLFGKEGIKFLEVLAQGSQGLEAMRAESERLGTAISEEAVAGVEMMNDAWGRAGLAVQGIWNSITTAVAPALTEVAKLATDFFVLVRNVSAASETIHPVWTAIGFVIEKLSLGFRGIFAVVSDTVQLISSLPGWLGGGELNADFAESNRLLDEIEAKSNGTAAATKQAAQAAEDLAIETERATEAAAKIEESYTERVRQLEIEAIALSGNTELAQQMKLAAEGYTKEQVAALMALEKQNKLIAETAEANKKHQAELATQQAETAKQQAKNAADRLKEIEKIKKAADDAFTNDVKNAMAAAKAYFADQKRKDQDRRDQITKGPQAADVGSAEAARIIAEQRNAQLANRAVPQRETTQEELVAKTKELLIAQAAEAKRQAELLAAMKEATRTMLDTRPKLFRG
jgi:hypothetical protein